MTTYSRGDVVYVPFKFTDREAAKNRPAVVTSSTAFNESRSDVIIAGVTSNLSRDHLSATCESDWESGGLIKPSAISGIIQTIRESQIRRRIGSLSLRDIESLDAMLKEMLDL